MTKWRRRSRAGKRSAASRTHGHTNVACAARTQSSFTASVAYLFAARRMDLSASGLMTRRKRAGGEHTIVVDLGRLSDEQLAAFARVLARKAVANTLKILGLDSGPTSGDNVGHQHKAAPASAPTLTEAKERVV